MRSAEEAFSELPDAKADDDMLELALHIIKKKAGRFDPTTFDDRYDAALVELVKMKMEGRKIAPPQVQQPTRPADLMEALIPEALVKQIAGLVICTAAAQNLLQEGIPDRIAEHGKNHGSFALHW